MRFIPTPLNGLYVIEIEPISDSRGWFARTFCKSEFEAIGHSKEWVQMNHTYTVKKGTIRGMHFQLPPHEEIKMVRCIAGVVYDVVIDIRKESATFLQWFGMEISATNRKMIYIPEGFAHGFQTLTDNCELVYNHSAFYAPGVEAGIRYDDPEINIQWPLPVSDISQRDSAHPLLNKSFKGI
jgi:dTDP-4-dehydrorhamnose 3,5-epimerase